MPALNRRKGAPLAVLAGVILLWAGGRAFLWQSPFPEDVDDTAAKHALAGDAVISGPESEQPNIQAEAEFELPAPHENLLFAHPLANGRNGSRPSVGEPITTEHFMPSISIDPPQRVVATAGPRLNASQTVVSGRSEGSPKSLVLAASLKARRWSFDAWLFVRPDSAAPNAVGLLPASYGASQLGGVLRYRLGRQSQHKPALYVRATSALSGAKQVDFAAGISARPIGKIPLSVQAEARLSDSMGRREIRPAVLAVTELPPAKLPLGFRGEVYAQGGYVGGDFATPFADGQLKLDRKIVELGGAELRAGGGVWGGAQKGASRVDVGPTTSIRFNLVDVPVRLSADYRHRVAGDAVPQSGIAFTLSTGF